MCGHKEEREVFGINQGRQDSVTPAEGTVL